MKPMQELYEMGEDELISYFLEIRAQKHELADLLGLSLSHLSYQKSILFAAREIAETARFIRIAKR